MRALPQYAVAALLAALIVGCGPRVRVRPVSLTVTDAVDGKPLAGVTVHRVIETWQTEFPWIIDPNVVHYYRVEEQATGAGGRVEFAPAEWRLRWHEYLVREWMLVNLDIMPWTYVDRWQLKWHPDLATDHGKLARLFDVHDLAHVWDFHCPLPERRGAVVATDEDGWPADFAGRTRRQKFDVLWRTEKLEGDRAEVRVELRPASPP